MRVRLLVSLLVGTLLLSGCGFGPREPGDVITGWYAAKTLQDGLGFFTDDAQIVDGGITYAGLANPTPRGVDRATTIAGWLEAREILTMEIDQGSVSDQRVTWREKRTWRERNFIEHYTAEATVVDGKIQHLQYALIGLPTLFVHLVCHAQPMFPPIEGLAPNTRYEDPLPGQSVECPGGPFIPTRHLQEDELALRKLIERTAAKPTLLENVPPISFEIEIDGKPIWVTFEMSSNPDPNSTEYLNRIAATPAVSLADLVAAATLPSGASDLEVAVVEEKDHAPGDVECFQTVLLRNPGPGALALPPKTIVVHAGTATISSAALPPILMPNSSIDVVAHVRWTLQPPSHLTVIVDREHIIPEASEQNNQVEFTVPTCILTGR